MYLTLASLKTRCTDPLASYPPVISPLFPGHVAIQLETGSPSFPCSPVCPWTCSSPWVVDEIDVCEFQARGENRTCYSGLLDEVMVQRPPTCPGPNRERGINCYVLEAIKCSRVALLHQPHVYSNCEKISPCNSFHSHQLRVKSKCLDQSLQDRA